MKKHPIDELFSSNLREHSAVPSTRAAELFQQRLAEKKKPKGIFFRFPARNYYWAAAASVLFVLTLGWFAFQADQNIQTLADNSEKVTPKEEPTTKFNGNMVQEKVTTIGIQESEKVLATNPTPVAKVVKNKVVKVATSPTPEKTVEQKQEEVKSPIFAPLILDEPIMDKLTVAVLDAEKNKKKEQAKQRKLQNENSTLFKNSVAETVIVISEIQPKEEQLYIPEISGDSRISIAQATQMGKKRQQADRSFIAKVVTEIKHLKHGEKLDVAGLNKQSDAIFARSEGGFIANEKAEFNYRLGRLKNVLSKNELR